MKLESFFEINFSAFSFLIFVLFTYQLPEVLMILVGSLTIHQSHHFAFIFTSCPHLVNGFRTSGCFPVDSQASITAKCPRNSSLFSTPFMRSEIEREIKSVRRNPSRSVQLSQNIWRKAFQALASFGESIKVENFVLDRSVGWCSRFGSNLSLLCYVIYHSILPFGRSS